MVQLYFESLKTFSLKCKKKEILRNKNHSSYHCAKLASIVNAIAIRTSHCVPRERLVVTVCVYVCVCERESVLAARQLIKLKCHISGVDNNNKCSKVASRLRVGNYFWHELIAALCQRKSSNRTRRQWGPIDMTMANKSTGKLPVKVFSA